MFISEDNRVRNYITWQSQNAITSTEFMQTEYDIKKQLNTFMGTNSAIDSIYIYNENAGKILNSGIGTINVKHFHDTSWLEDYKSIHDSLGVHILPERTPVSQSILISRTIFLLLFPLLSRSQSTATQNVMLWFSLI